MIDIELKDLSGGQPKRRNVRSKQDAKSWYKLGRTAANLERDRIQLHQEMAANMLISSQVQQATQKLLDIQAEMARSVPPPNQSVMGYPGNIPPLGIEGTGELPANPSMAGMPPDMGGMGSPGMGGAPDMGGGQIVPSMPPPMG